MTHLRQIILFVAVAVFTMPATAQEVDLPIEVQIPLLSKILSFDRNLQREEGDTVVIGVVYQRKVRPSLTTGDAVLDFISSDPRVLGGVPLRAVPVDLSDYAHLDQDITRHGIDVLYVTPLRAVSVDEITGISRERSVLTSTGVPDYLREGIALGFAAERRQPRILINLQAARAEGADFSSELLKLAQIIEAEPTRRHSR